MTDENRGLEDVLGINRRNLELISTYNPRSAYPLVDDKLKTKEILSKVEVPFPETLHVVGNFLELDSSIQLMKETQSFVIKPARGRAGGGILLAEQQEAGSTWRSPSGKTISEEDLRKHLGDILFGVYSFGRTDDRALVEKRVVQHDFFDSIYPGGIADIRILVFQRQAVLAMLRVPTGRSEGRANLHQGALGVGIDLTRGITQEGLWRKERVVRHPDTGVELKGLTIPFWKEMVRYAETAAGAVPLKYLGIDLVIDKQAGPLVLEMNARPGLQIQVVNNTGLVPVLAGIGRDR